MSDIEDRTKEFDELTHLLMATGMVAPESANSAYAKYYGLEPGKYNNFDLDPIKPASLLGQEAGTLDLDAQLKKAGVDPYREEWSMFDPVFPNTQEYRDLSPNQVKRLTPGEATIPPGKKK